MLKKLLFFFLPFALFAESENDYYTITDIPVPEGFEVSCIDVLPDNKIAVGSRRGDIYIVDNAYDNDPKNDKWTLFATGIHEPLGLSYYKGWLWCTQRPEVTRMKDADGDGFADIYECISDDWGIDGNYHEYAFGTKHDKDGNIWVVLCLTGSGGASSDYRGWCVRITEDGKMIPTTSGIRSPGGMGINHKGDVFYSDNQGLWTGTSCVKHLKAGSFQGNPTGNKYYSLTDAIGPRVTEPKSGSRIVLEREKIKEFVPPAANLPHTKLGKSTSGIALDHTNGKFGPFSNQLFANDQNASLIARLALEEVNGVYQGMSILFREGFGSGNVPTVMAKDGSLFVGGTNRGWNSKGRKPGALERVNWTGKVPFEIHSMNITKTGFNLKFTQKIDPSSLSPETIKADANAWIYQSGYGSPEVDQVDLKITDVKVAADGMSAHITLDKIYKGHNHNFDFSALKSAGGKSLLHSKPYYTVNEVLGEVHIVPPQNPEKKKKKK